MDTTVEQQVDAAVAAARDAAPALADMTPHERADLLGALAKALDARAERLVPLAIRESHLPEARVRGELARTTGQLRLFGDVLRDGAMFHVAIDTADPDAAPPRPDLRRMLVPLGVVAVFAASNFPFAFSVAGGDTASALAAGCPVVVKAHPGHPELSRAVTEVLADALAAAGAPRGCLTLVEGVEAGVALVQHPGVRAVGFTGSTRGGRALFDLAVSRPDPIPFYGELGGLNPVFVTEAAVRARGDEIARGFVASYTLGVGQYCTKPGLLVSPATDALRDLVVDGLAGVAAAPMLNERIAEGYASALGRVGSRAGVSTLVSGASSPEGTAPTLLETSAARVVADPELLEECFGPTSLLVSVGDDDEILALADRVEGSLTASVFAEPAEDAALLARLVPRLQEVVGRVVFDGWPTGVSVGWAQQHGGPWPATTMPLHTSVGAAAVERFLRPVAYQDAPASVLPAALRDDNPLGLPRRVNGHWAPAPASDV